MVKLQPPIFNNGRPQVFTGGNLQSPQIYIFFLVFLLFYFYHYLFVSSYFHCFERNYGQMEDGMGSAYTFSVEIFSLDDYFLAWKIPKRRVTSEVELGILGVWRGSW